MLPEKETDKKENSNKYDGLEPEEIEKMIAADAKEKPIEEAAQENMKKLGKTVDARLFAMSKPLFNVLVGFFFSMILGSLFPILGYIFMEQIFVMFDTSDMDEFRKKSNFWCLMIFLLAITAFVTFTISKSMFGYVTENITKNIREACYTGILSKDIGWFDDSNHSSG